jgi:flavin reductase (DIM6/NTAB) family NADH-FMN oxidoreductase RutF
MNNESALSFKQIMGSYPTGVTVITTVDDHGKPYGLTVNSFASVSLDPILVSWCIDLKSSSLEAFKEADSFAVHVLAAEQEEVCWAFAGKDPDRFSKVNWTLSDNNLPVIPGSFGIMECKKVQQIDAGDHIVFIGEVVNIENENKEPMLYFRRKVGMVPAGW